MGTTKSEAALRKTVFHFDRIANCDPLHPCILKARVRPTQPGRQQRDTTQFAQVFVAQPAEFPLAEIFHTGFPELHIGRAGHEIIKLGLEHWIERATSIMNRIVWMRASGLDAAFSWPQRRCSSRKPRSSLPVGKSSGSA